MYKIVDRVQFELRFACLVHLRTTFCCVLVVGVLRVREGLPLSKGAQIRLSSPEEDRSTSSYRTDAISVFISMNEPLLFRM